jgi:hypothetical protein
MAHYSPTDYALTFLFLYFPSNPKYNDYYKYDYHIPEGLDTVLDVDVEDLENSLRRVSGLDFETMGGDRISPLYDIHRERYVVYWDIR